MERKSLSISPIVSFNIALLIILSGCAKPEHTSRTRSTRSQITQTYTLTSPDPSIEASYTVLNAKESKAYLGQNVIEQGYQPIRIILTNHSNRTFHVSENNIQLPTEPVEKVARASHKSTAARAIGLGVPGAICAVPAGVMTGMIVCMSPFYPLAIPAFILGGLGCLVPAVISSVDSVKTNNHIDASFSACALKEQELLPYSTVSGIVFVPKKSFVPDFEVKITDMHNTPLVLKAQPGAPVRPECFA